MGWLLALMTDYCYNQISVIRVPTENATKLTVSSTVSSHFSWTICAVMVLLILPSTLLILLLYEYFVTFMCANWQPSSVIWWSSERPGQCQYPGNSNIAFLTVFFLFSFQHTLVHCIALIHWCFIWCSAYSVTWNWCKTDKKKIKEVPSFMMTVLDLLC